MKAYLVSKALRDSQWVVTILFTDEESGIKQMKDYTVGSLSDSVVERLAYNESLTFTAAKDESKFSYTDGKEINLHPNIPPVPEPDSKEDLILRFNKARARASLYKSLIIEKFPIDQALVDEQVEIYLTLYKPEYVGL